MKIRLYDVKLTFESDGALRERTFVAIGVDESDAIDRVKSYYINHPLWTGTIVRAEAWQAKFDDFAIVTGETP